MQRSPLKTSDALSAARHRQTILDSSCCCPRCTRTGIVAASHGDTAGLVQARWQGVSRHAASMCMGTKGNPSSPQQLFPIMLPLLVHSAAGVDTHISRAAGPPGGHHGLLLPTPSCPGAPPSPPKWPPSQLPTAAVRQAVPACPAGIHLQHARHGNP